MIEEEIIIAVYGIFTASSVHRTKICANYQVQVHA
jgi:hypothetical protein